MSTATVRSTTSRDLLRPVAAAMIGAVTFAATMTSGEVFDLNADGPDAPGASATDLALYAAFVLAAGALAVWLATRALAGAPRRLERTTLGLAVASAVTFVAFWSGWPHVFAAVAIGLALEHRRRVGSFSGMTGTALAIATISFVATSVICVIG